MDSEPEAENQKPDMISGQDPAVNAKTDIPYDSLSLVHFQIGIQAPKQNFFEPQFCVGLFQTVCKQWAKGPGKIPKF